jgi:hypothetical protein
MKPRCGSALGMADDGDPEVVSAATHRSVSQASWVLAGKGGRERGGSWGRCT